jgi:hypothetical protein
MLPFQKAGARLTAAHVSSLSLDRRREKIHDHTQYPGLPNPDPRLVDSVYVIEKPRG